MATYHTKTLSRVISSPTAVDTNDDGISDAAEIEAGTDPLNPQDPKPESTTPPESTMTTVPEFILEMGLLSALVIISLRRQRKKIECSYSFKRQQY